MVDKHWRDRARTVIDWILFPFALAAFWLSGWLDQRWLRRQEEDRGK
jgi:hypothetical protein